MTDAHGPVRRVLGVLAAQVVLVCAVAFLAITTLAGLRHNAGIINTVDGWIRDYISLAAGALCVLRSVMVRRDRTAWMVLGGGLLAYGAGNLYFYLHVVHLDPQPTPSPSDIGWLTLYPCVFVAVILLLRGRVRMFHPSLWLDGLVGGLGVAALASGLSVTVLGRLPSASWAAGAVNLSYPLADLLLLVMVGSVLGLLGWQAGLVWWMLGAFVVGFAVADTSVLYEISSGHYTPGGSIDVLWAAALTVPAFAAWRRQPPAAPPAVTGWAILVVPTVFALSSLGLLVAGARSSLSLVTVVLAATTVLAALARAGLTFDEVRQLAVSKLQARTDDLTGLLNRRGFLERLEAASRGARDRQPFALLIIDLDRFKDINDSLGHQTGDNLLRQVGARIASALRPEDDLARLGGDEFSVLLEQADVTVADLVARRVLVAMSEPFDLGGMTLHVDASIGSAVHPDDAEGTTALMRRADVAMYAAKAGRTGSEHYTSGTEEDGVERLDTIEALRKGLRAGELLLHYQLKVDLRTGFYTGVEALVRWQHPTRGLIQPETFVPLAEQTGLMRAMTPQILDMALRQARLWWNRGVEVSVAVNLSTSNLLDTGFADQVAQALATYELPPRALELEITETTLMLDRVRSAIVLRELRDMGISIAVDDYGTGYSSLAYLRELPVDTLKLDKSFVMNLDTDPLAVAIVKSTVALAHALGLRIVVEGVETATAVRQLEEFGCDLAQGYYFGMPRTGEDLTPSLVKMWSRDNDTATVSSTSPAAPADRVWH